MKKRTEVRQLAEMRAMLNKPQQLSNVERIEVEARLRIGVAQTQLSLAEQLVWQLVREQASPLATPATVTQCAYRCLQEANRLMSTLDLLKAWMISCELSSRTFNKEHTFGSAVTSLQHEAGRIGKACTDVILANPAN
jgi:hypothetical protein